MDTSLWYEYYQGVVYPLDLRAPPALGRLKSTVPSLTSLSARYIVQDSTMTTNALQFIPSDLCIVLMQEALAMNKEIAIDVLLSHWPFETLSLKKLVPNMYTSVRPLYDVIYLSEITRQCLRYTTCLTHTFLECIKNKTPTKLRYLDMSGFPTPEVILYYLATHCMLSYNEARQNVMVNMYNKAAKLLPQPVPDAVMADDQFLPKQPIMVKMDGFVAADQTLSELSKALKVSGFNDSKLCLCLQKLDATCLGEPRLNILLGQINPEYLTSIRLKYNSINCEGFCSLAPVLEKFTNLCALDLSCNSISIYQCEETTEIFNKTLSSLPHLVRLDLSSNRLKNKLRRLLSGIQRPLIQLRLSGCGLTGDDVRYLSNSHHANNLEFLDLSNNTLGPICDVLGQLLDAACGTLLVLELDDASIQDEGMLLLIPVISRLKEILYINLAQKHVQGTTGYHLAETLAIIPHLQAVKYAYCTECYEGDYELMDERKNTFFSLMNRALKTVNEEINMIIVDRAEVLVE